MISMFKKGNDAGNDFLLNPCFPHNVVCTGH